MASIASLFSFRLLSYYPICFPKFLPVFIRFHRRHRRLGSPFPAAGLKFGMAQPILRRTARVASSVDAAAMEMVRRPGRFDVLVTENLLGDILSDLAAGLVGGLGVAPSADVGDRHAVFQPCHGTAPDIAGRGVANPLAAILSGVMLLDHLADARDDPAPRASARRIESAVAAALEAGEAQTADLGGSASTLEATRAVLRRIG